MRVRFWGTRGSIATPGPGTNHFGGNTSCVELTTDGEARRIAITAEGSTWAARWEALEAAVQPWSAAA